jgi:hypothetical protein
MTDAELWQACVESGFVASEWWPKKPDDKYDLTLHKEHGWIWVCSPFSSGSCEPENARARILAALVEWAGKTLQHWAHIGHTKGVDVHAAWMGGESKRLGSGEDLTLALLACYRQHKENA